MNRSLAQSEGTLRPLLRLALPVLAEQLLHLLVGLVDTALAGRILREEPYLAAIGLMAYLLWLLPALFASVTLGATALVSRYAGGGNFRRANLVANQAITLGLLLAVGMTLLVALAGKHYVSFMQLRGEAAEHAVTYLMILVPVIPCIMIQQAVNASLRGMGDTLTGLLVMIGVNGTNILLSAGLCTGWGPFPELGWQGLALGTATGHLLGAAMLVGLLVRGRSGLRWRVGYMRLHLPIVRRLLRIGLPGGLDAVATVACHHWFVSIVFSLGTTQAAAHSLGVRIESLAYLPGAAFQVAAATMAGQFLGARDPHRAVRSVWLACGLGGVLMCSAGLAFFFGGQLLVQLFLGEATVEVAELCTTLLRIVAVAMPAMALSMIMTGALRGAGDTRVPLMITFVGFLGVRIPGAYWLTHPEYWPGWLDLPYLDADHLVIGAWWAMLSDIMVRSLLVLWRFLQGGWRKIRV